MRTKATPEATFDKKKLTGDFFPYEPEAYVTLEFMMREGYKWVTRYADGVYDSYGAK